jgi:hypothetical protein
VSSEVNRSFRNAETNPPAFSIGEKGEVNKEKIKIIRRNHRLIRKITFANDAKEICRLTEPVEIHWNDRSVAIQALVVEDASEVLLGVLPLEGMDLIVDPVNQKLAGVHEDQVLYLVKTAVCATTDCRPSRQRHLSYRCMET